MTYKQRRLRRQQLDRQLRVPLASIPAQPQGGWIQAIREALGMTLDAFGAKLGVSRQTAHQLEQGEANSTITLKRLRSAAAALDCELVVLVRPRRSLEEVVRDRALAVARADVMRMGHTMAMEEQAVASEQLEELIIETADELIERGDNRLWE